MSDIFHPDAPLDAKTEQARRAVKVFRQMQPSLTAFARALTRRSDVRVELKTRAASGAMTDGRRIYYVPPIGLGDMRPHNRALCDKRDEHLQQRCPACFLREDVLTSIYHEIAHICFDSFAPVTDSHKVEITKRAVAERGSKYAKALEKRLEAEPMWQTNSYAGVVQLISPFLPLIFNALEDARVNREMFTARTGTQVMFEASAHDIFTKGVEQKDPLTGETVRIQWRDYPLNAQIVIGCYCKISGYDIEGWFHEYVERDLNDPDLIAVLNRMNTVRGPAGIYELSFDVLDELRRLGYCKSDVDPEPEEGPDGSEEEPQPSEAPADAELDERGDDGSGADGDEGDAGSPEPGSEGEPSDDADAPDKGDGDEGDGDSEGADSAGADEAGGDPGELDGEGESEGESDGADEGGPGEDSSGDGEPGDGAESDPSLSDESGSSDADEDSSSDAGGSDDEADGGGSGESDPVEPTSEPATGDSTSDDGGPSEGEGDTGAGSNSPDSSDDAGDPDSEGAGDMESERPDEGDAGSPSDTATGQPGDTSAASSSDRGSKPEVDQEVPPSDRTEGGEPEDATEGEAGSSSAEASGRGAEPDSEPSPDGDRSSSTGQLSSDVRGDEREEQGDPDDHGVSNGAPVDEGHHPRPAEHDSSPLADEVDDQGGGVTDEPTTSGREGERHPDGQSHDRDGEQLAPGSESESDAEAEASAIDSTDGGDPGDPSADDDQPSPDDSGSPNDSSSGAEDEVEAIDTGADEGEGGTEISFTPEEGDASTVAPKIAEWLGHGELSPFQKQQKAADEAEVQVAIIQGEYFETPSSNIAGVWECKFGDDVKGKAAAAWNGRYHREPDTRIAAGIDGEIDPPESALGPALMRMRVAFADNKRATEVPNLKSGKVNARVLGKRVFHDDPRLFKRRQIPGKKDYLVVIGLDISGSTVGVNLLLTKRAVMAQANLLARMGIKFAIYAHTASRSIYGKGTDLDVYTIKDPDEQWSDSIKVRLRELGPGAANLDGHALEYLRKAADKYQATDKIILYYSDGKMPAENYEEELTILQREIRHCRRVGYTLLGVGIRTDSPARHGLDTVQVDDDADIVKVVRHIERRLLGA